MRKSPPSISGVGSMQFDLDEDLLAQNEQLIANSRKACRSVMRGNQKVNNAQPITANNFGQSKAMKLRKEIKLTTPDSEVIGFQSRMASNNYDEDTNSLNRSVYSNLQSKIDKTRKFSSAMNSPQARIKKVGMIHTLEPMQEENFTDIRKIRPKEELAPIEIRNKLNFDITNNIPMKSNRDLQAANTNTTAFLYSKIPSSNKPKIKKSNIISGVHDFAETESKNVNSTKMSLQHKSTASSLIATLGQRKREPKSLNMYPFKNSQISHEPSNLDASPRVSTEKVRKP